MVPIRKFALASCLTVIFSGCDKSAVTDSSESARGVSNRTAADPAASIPLAAALVSPSSSPCPMAHCGISLSDQMPVAPITSAKQAWSAVTTNGSLGLGSVVGLDFIAVSFSVKSPYLQVLNLDGSVRWTSGTLLGKLDLCPPLVGDDGSVYAADSKWVIRFSASGAVIWKVANPSAAQPFGLNLTSEGLLVGAGKSGPAWGVRQSDGGGATTVTLADGADKFITLNTSSVSGTRMYVATQSSRAASKGRLYALETTGGTLKVAWFWAFTGTTGGSPTLSGNRIYFDGRAMPGTGASCLCEFGLQDSGTAATLLWAIDTGPLSGGGTNLQVSPAIDPRGGVWVNAVQGENVLRLDELTGAVIQTVSLTGLLGSKTTPNSVFSIAAGGPSPAAYLGASGSTNNVIAIDLNSGSLLWKYDLGSAQTYAQFPSVAGLVVVMTSAKGVIALSAVTSP